MVKSMKSESEKTGQWIQSLQSQSRSSNHLPYHSMEPTRYSSMLHAMLWGNQVPPATGMPTGMLWFEDFRMFEFLPDPTKKLSWVESSRFHLCGNRSEMKNSVFPWGLLIRGILVIVVSMRRERCPVIELCRVDGTPSLHCRGAVEKQVLDVLIRYRKQIRIWKTTKHWRKMSSMAKLTGRFLIGNLGSHHEAVPLVAQNTSQGGKSPGRDLVTEWRKRARRVR